LIAYERKEKKKNLFKAAIPKRKRTPDKKIKRMADGEARGSKAFESCRYVLSPTLFGR